MGLWKTKYKGLMFVVVFLSQTQFPYVTNNTANKMFRNKPDKSGKKETDAAHSWLGLSERRPNWKVASREKV